MWHLMLNSQTLGTKPRKPTADGHAQPNGQPTNQEKKKGGAGAAASHCQRRAIWNRIGTGVRCSLNPKFPLAGWRLIGIYSRGQNFRKRAAIKGSKDVRFDLIAAKTCLFEQ